MDASVTFFGNRQVGSSCGVFSGTSSVWDLVTNLEKTIVTKGGGVLVALLPTGESSGGPVGTRVIFTGASGSGGIRLKNTTTGSILSVSHLTHTTTGSGNPVHTINTAIIAMDFPASGSNTYRAEYIVDGTTAAITYYKLVLWEMGPA